MGRVINVWRIQKEIYLLGRASRTLDVVELLRDGERLSAFAARRDRKRMGGFRRARVHGEHRLRGSVLFGKCAALMVRRAGN